MTDETTPDREPGTSETPAESDAAPPKDTPAADASAADAATADAPTAPAGAPNAEPVTAEPVTAEPVTAEPVTAEPNAGTLDAEPATPSGADAPPTGDATESAPAPSEAVAAPDAAETTPRNRRALLGYLGVAILGIAIGAGGLALASGGLAGATPTPSPTPSPTPTPAVVAEGGSFGRADAPVTLEVWADYQCPFCRLEDLLFGGALEREYVTPGIVRVVYRDFAFLGQESIDAAVAARCAGQQDPAAQLRYHDALYTFQQGENQGRFVRENLVQIAAIVGVPDSAAFTACLDDASVAKAVADETTAGRDVGIASTPTMRLRGPGGERVLTGFSQQWPALRDAIEAVAVAATPTPSGSPAASGTPTPGASGTPVVSPSPAASPSPGVSPSPAASATTGPSATPSPVASPTPSPATSPTPTP